VIWTPRRRHQLRRRNLPHRWTPSAALRYNCAQGSEFVAASLAKLAEKIASMKSKRWLVIATYRASPPATGKLAATPLNSGRLAPVAVLSAEQTARSQEELT
jgi:hypothetical protein